MMTSGLRKVVFTVLLFGVAIVGYQYMIKPANKNLAGIKGRLETKLSQLSKFGKANPLELEIGKANPLELENGQDYIVSKQTPLMPFLSPADPIAAIQQMKQIPKGGVFEVLEKVKKRNTPWYKVNASNQKKQRIGTGWINSTALLGQELKEATDDLTKQLEQLDEAIKFFESKLPPKSQIHEVLEQVTVIAQKQGLKPKTFRTLQEKDNNGYIEQPLKMELVGNFSSFYSFLLELEKLPRIIKIRELKLDKKKVTEGQISAEFILSIFFQNKTV